MRWTLLNMSNIRVSQYKHVTVQGNVTSGSSLLCGLIVANIGTAYKSVIICNNIAYAAPVVFSSYISARDSIGVIFEPPIQCENGIYCYLGGVDVLKGTIFYGLLS